MEKTRRVIVIMFSIIYLILIILRVNIPRVLYIFLGIILLLNQAIDEWNKYLQTKKKFYLVIPIITVIILIFVIFQCVITEGFVKFHT